MNRKITCPDSAPERGHDDREIHKGTGQEINQLRPSEFPGTINGGSEENDAFID
jgi:hypothetical protein